MAINELNNGGAQVDPNFNFDIEQARIARQRALAQKQLETQQPQGQMVSGWYVAPNGASYLAAGLEKILGAYGTHRADQEEKDNIAVSNANAVALAQKLADVKGKQNVDPNDPTKITYEAPTFNDKLPFYQQLAQSGPFGQMVAKKEMEKDLAGPSFQKIGDGETLYQFDKNGRAIGQFAGGQKKTELDRKFEMTKKMHPELTDAQAWDVASGHVQMDPQSGILINKATGTAPVYGRVLPQATAPGPAPSDSSSLAPITIPPRGQRFSAPNAAPAQALPNANPVAAHREQKAAKEAADKAREEQVKVTPKIAEVKTNLAGVEAGIQNVKDLLALIGYDENGKKVAGYKDGQANTGPIMGRALFFTKGNQDFDRRSKQLVFDAVNGKLGGGLSEGDRKAIESKEANSKYDPEVNAAALLSTLEILRRRQQVFAEELKGYGVTPPVNTNVSGTQGAATKPTFKW